MEKCEHGHEVPDSLKKVFFSMPEVWYHKVAKQLDPSRCIFVTHKKELEDEVARRKRIGK